MKTIRLLSSGGLGDACMSFAKLSSKEAPFDINNSDVHITHQVCSRTDAVLKEQIRDFYSYQGIKNDIYIVASEEDELDPKDFDYTLGGGWSGKGWKNECSCWEINPFPNIKYNKIEGIDVVIVVASGRNQNRRFDIDDVSNFIKEVPTVILAGAINDKNYENIGRNNKVNKTNFIEFVDLIASSNMVIGHSGFCCYFAGMLNKKLYYVSEGIPSIGNIHPLWNAKEINNLKELL